MKPTLKTLILLTLTTIFTQSNAATWTWVGGISTDWNTKTNWATSSASSKPQAADDVIINPGAVNQPVISANHTISNLTMNGGILDVTNHTLTVSNLTLLKGGNITNSNDNSTGKVKTDDMEVNSTSPVSFNSVGTLQVSVDGTMTFTSGIIETTSDDILIMNDNASVANAKNASHVDGPVRKIGNDAFVFPVGNGTVYAPIAISDFSSNSTTQYTTASYGPASAGTLVGGGTLSSKESWSVTRSNASQISKITLYYDAALRSGGIVDSSDLSVAVFNGLTWTSFSAAAAGTKTVGTLTTANRVSGSIQAVTFSSPLSLNALPIELLSFSASKSAQHVDIAWSTATEINNDHFTIEKSIDGQTWSAIATVKGAGSSERVNQYASIDASPVNGTQYYRLVQTDYNGASSYSDIVVINFQKESSINAVSTYPNPTHNVVNVTLNANEQPESIHVVILNAMGQKVLELDQFAATFTLDMSELENGVYSMEIYQNETVTQTKIIKN